MGKEKLTANLKAIPESTEIIIKMDKELLFFRIKINMKENGKV
jgi:hypothetical protein